jgi:hypothetical protein
MNKCIEVANGECLLFLISGDCLADSNVLEIVMNEIIDCSHKDDTLFIGSTIQSGIGLIHQPQEFWSLLYLYNSALPHQGMFIPRKICNIIPYNEDYNNASDWLSTKNLRWLQRCKSSFVTLTAHGSEVQMKTQTGSLEACFQKERTLI